MNRSFTNNVELIKQIMERNAVKRGGANELIFIIACIAQAVAARDSEQSIRPYAFIVCDVAEHFLNAPFAFGITELGLLFVDRPEQRGQLLRLVGENAGDAAIRYKLRISLKIGGILAWLQTLVRGHRLLLHSYN